MNIIREAAAAGRFYPDVPHELSDMVDMLLANHLSQACTPKALIVPHAGYQYSGPTAAYAYNTLKPLRDKISKVILLGPSHYVAFSGLAYTKADNFLTPLGSIEQDHDNLALVTHLPQVKHIEQAHLQEHSLEVQLPFLQRVLSHFTLTPLVVGDATADQVSEVIEHLWGGNETLIVISSDLSHYLNYTQAQTIDLATTHAIEQLDSSQIEPPQACGRIPIIGLLDSAKRHGLRVTTLSLLNSGDTAGDKDRVVGYGAYALQ